MRGLTSAEPKIIGSLHQPLSKMIMPDPVDHHPGKERVVMMGYPFRQLTTAFSLRSI